ncbi:MAG: hypothetical protein ITG00_01260 [Flavobacterium sp.]|nr:hypothetical protein [Flavobacterium sp.]
MNTKSRIENIQANGYDIDFSETFSDAFETYKKIALHAGLVLIIVVIVMMAVIFGIIGAAVGFAAFTDNLTGFQPQNFSTLHQVLYILVLSVFGGIANPFNAGIIKMAFQADAGHPFSVATAFEYYSSSKFGNLFIAGFMITLFGAGLGMILDSLIFPFISTILSVTVSFLTFLTVPLIIFGNLNAVDAIKSSCIVVLKNPLIILGLLIVGILLSLVGFIAFCIGYFFTMPFLYALYYSIYKNSVGISTMSEIDEISGIDNI